MRDPVPIARLRFYDMLDNIDHVREATANLTLESFLKNRLMRLATERALGIISEASRHLPDDLKAKAPEIPWPKVAGIGNVLRHDYREVAPRIIWNLVMSDLEPLQSALRNMLAEIGEE